MQKSVKFALAAVALVIVVGGAGFYWFVLRDTAPGKASLQAGGQSTATAADPATADGSWKVAPATNVFVGYRVQELFAGDTIQKTAVGRTPAVTGTMKISGSTVDSVSITADVTQLHSDQSTRDGVIREQGLETAKFPQATFVLTEPITLPGAPVKGKKVDVTATGKLTLHGQTKTVQVPLQAEWDGATISVAGSAPILFGDYGMTPPHSAFVARVDDHGTFELQLTFVPA
jgi:polyisoprenoid-binding protein YceI